jgi:hypothetical protein
LTHEQIHFPSQLKALCLASKQLRALTIPRLYKGVVIDLWSNTQVDKIMRRVANGAATHFRYTNEVVFIARKRLLGPESALARSDRMKPQETRDCKRLKQIQSMTAGHKFHTVRMLLQLFPHNYLKSFQSVVHVLSLLFKLQASDMDMLIAIIQNQIKSNIHDVLSLSSD